MGGKAGFCPDSPAVFPPEIELVRGMRLLPNASIIFFASSLTCCFLFQVLVFLFDVRRFTLATKLLLLYVPFYCTIAGSGAATRALRNWGRGRRQRHCRFQIRKLVLCLRCLACYVTLVRYLFYVRQLFQSACGSSLGSPSGTTNARKTIQWIVFSES